jgi:hypothetical protein
LSNPVVQRYLAGQDTRYAIKRTDLAEGGDAPAVPVAGPAKAGEAL